jgi:hypothetical protein
MVLYVIKIKAVVLILLWNLIIVVGFGGYLDPNLFILKSTSYDI